MDRSPKTKGRERNIYPGRILEHENGRADGLYKCFKSKNTVV
jgi:hypothetical protein